VSGLVDSSHLNSWKKGEDVMKEVNSAVDVQRGDRRLACYDDFCTRDTNIFP